ncbi:MAG: TlpA family protein disulfide reductase [Thermoplasmata archaeon]|nr:TlpA family protein disulfide reductase [Thermoplasmata archaeon]
MKKAVLIALVLFSLGLTLVFLIEEPAPDFTVVDAYGQSFELSDHRGEVVVLEFMFTTCPSCLAQTEIFKDVKASYSEGDLTIVSITVSLSDNNTVLRQYSESHEAGWVFATDSENLIETYGVGSVPHTLFIDRSGRVASSYVGVLDEDGVSRRIDNAMSLMDPIITTTLSVALIAAGIGILSYIGYSKRDTIRERLFGGAESS